MPLREDNCAMADDKDAIFGIEAHCTRKYTALDITT
jgi:hypothetical protein